MVIYNLLFRQMLLTEEKVELIYFENVVHAKFYWPSHILHRCILYLLSVDVQILNTSNRAHFFMGTATML